MTTIYLVNENPDGSGRWWRGGERMWGSAFLYMKKPRAEEDAERVGGHVVEFTMGAKPEPREPDAIMVCEPSDGSPDWDDLLPLPLEPEDQQRLATFSHPTRKVYLDTPPPSDPPWRDQLCAVLGWDVPSPDDAYAVQRALAEVSRLSKALDAARRELGLMKGEVTQLRLSQLDADIRDLKRRGKLDELAKQEPVAWRRQAPLGEEFFYGRKLSQESIAAWRHRGHTVEPLYAAPKPAAEPASDGFNGPLTRKYAAMEDARDLNTCAACNAGPSAIGPVHTCGLGEPAPTCADCPIGGREGDGPVCPNVDKCDRECAEFVRDMRADMGRKPGEACCDLWARVERPAPADTPAMVEGRSGAMFAIGDTAWPGISKLVEECGELLQVCGKLMGTRGKTDHWDGSCLRNRLHEEVADVAAAVDFVVEHCKLSAEFICARRARKAELFVKWHRADLEMRGGK